MLGAQRERRRAAGQALERRDRCRGGEKRRVRMRGARIVAAASNRGRRDTGTRPGSKKREKRRGSATKVTAKAAESLLQEIPGIVLCVQHDSWNSYQHTTSSTSCPA